MISVTSNSFVHPGARPFEVVERKGLGHPDTLADLIADQFSFMYCQYCLRTFGQVLNHAVDKLTLIGSGTRVNLGAFEVISPVTVLLIGKVTPSVGSVRVPIDSILRNAVARVFGFSLRDTAILAHTNIVVHNSFSAALDRPSDFYFPGTIAQAKHIGRTESASNDTVFCTGSSPRSPLELLVLELELAVTAPKNRAAQPEAVGTDVKVMAVRRNELVDITICVPCDPRFIRTRAEYTRVIEEVGRHLHRVVSRSSFPTARLNVNTKDADGGMYLAPFGTSLGKSDCGAVGRGNRFGGTIAAFRPGNVEAPAGKNPLHHGGKLYTIAAQRIADQIHSQCALNSAVCIVARNGEALDKPAFVNIDLDRGDSEHDLARMIASSLIGEISEISRELVCVDPLLALGTALDGSSGLPSSVKVEYI